MDANLQTENKATIRVKVGHRWLRITFSGKYLRRKASSSRATWAKTRSSRSLVQSRQPRSLWLRVKCSRG